MTPDESAEATLVAAARKELAYLERFGQPILPFRRERRPGYHFQEQPPSTHIENLKRYLRIASSLVPTNPALAKFSIRHPDLQQSNIIVRRSSSAGWHVASLLDWQHASILPSFLLTGIPHRLQNHSDPVSQSMTPPSLPENFDELDDAERRAAEEVHRRRLGHYHYVTSTSEHNGRHYEALTDPLGVLRNRLFDCARNPWEGETLELQVALIRATEAWATFARSGAPCPVVFDAEEVRATMELDEVQRKADEVFEIWQGMLGLGPEGWVPAQDCGRAVAFCRQAKEQALVEAESPEDRAEIMGHWPWDDMDEGKYA